METENLISTVGERVSRKGTKEQRNLLLKGNKLHCGEMDKYMLIMKNKEAKCIP